MSNLNDDYDFMIISPKTKSELISFSLFSDSQNERTIGLHNLTKFVIRKKKIHLFFWIRNNSN